MTRRTYVSAAVTAVARHTPAIIAYIVHYVSYQIYLLLTTICMHNALHTTMS
jgi:hypothetical protein